MNIQSILDRNGGEVITIRATETVKTAADRMRARGIAALVMTSGEPSPVSFQNATSSAPSLCIQSKRFP